jgi:DNA-binding transcriptional LysR family regulator
VRLLHHLHVLQRQAAHRLAGRGEVEAGRLVRVLENWTPPFGGLCLYHPGRRNPSAALKAFIGLARKLGAKSELR